MTSDASARLRLQKLHGLGNDFLIAIDPGVPESSLAELAVRLCDRRRGIGADGLIVTSPSGRSGVDASMILHNSDGSRAELSGNGVRCLGHAMVRAANQVAGELVVDTDAGLRSLTVQPGDSPDAVQASVGMGQATEGPATPELALELARGELGSDVALRAATVDVGNPHLVVEVADPATIALAPTGAALEAHFTEGINVHLIAAADSSDTLSLRVWERGAGVTEACGTGAVASAHVASSWGLVGDAARVVMPGGEVQVELGGSELVLVGPSVFVADIEVSRV